MDPSTAVVLVVGILALAWFLGLVALLSAVAWLAKHAPNSLKHMSGILRAFGGSGLTSIAGSIARAVQRRQEPEKPGEQPDETESTAR